MIGIYKITNPLGSVYIGQSWDIKRREKKYNTINVQNQIKIYNSIHKYGWDAHIFEIIHELPKDTTQEILDRYEVLYWQLYKDCNFKILNIKEPGRGGKHSEESKVKIKNTWKNKIKNGFKVKPMTEGGRKRVSEKNRINMLNPERLTYMLLFNIGKEVSKETRLKLATYGMLNKQHTQEGKDKISFAAINRFKNKFGGIVQLSLLGDYIKTWDSFKSIHNMLGIDKKSISYVCQNKPNYNTAGGFKWVYKNNYN